MSLILEALRKSEADRRRGETPNVHVELSPSPELRRTVMPAWGWWMIAVVIGATGWWLHTKTTLALLQVAAPIATPSIVHQKPEAEPLPPVQHLSTPPMHANAPIPASMATREAVVPSLPRNPPPIIAISNPAAVIPSSPADGHTLHLSDLSIEERRRLPPLKLSMHMWNDDPMQRFVILDGNRLHEGDRIGEAIVTTITPDGVMLDWNGRRLELPIR